MLYNSRFHRTDGRVFADSVALEHPVDVKDKNAQLLDYIFHIDPNTGVPRGDLALFLGENTNSEVKQFIEMNLLKDNVQETTSVSIPNDILNKMRETINDDDIAYFSRNDGESSDAYAERLHQYFEDEKYKNALRRETNRLKKIMESTKEEK